MIARPAVRVPVILDAQDLALAAVVPVVLVVVLAHAQVAPVAPEPAAAAVEGAAPAALLVALEPVVAHAQVIVQ